MALGDLRTLLPDWAKDIRVNLSGLPETPGLTKSQLWGTMLATAAASRNARVLAAVREDAGEHLDEPGIAAALAAASLMAMNNVYYRFTHLVGEPEYGALPARLRMTFLGNPGIPKEDFELLCLAVSAINGCGQCMAAHARVVRDKGLSAEAVQNAVRVAAVIQSVAVALEATAA